MNYDSNTGRTSELYSHVTCPRRAAVAEGLTAINARINPQLSILHFNKNSTARTDRFARVEAGDVMELCLLTAAYFSKLSSAIRAYKLWRNGTVTRRKAFKVVGSLAATSATTAFTRSNGF